MSLRAAAGAVLLVLFALINICDGAGTRTQTDSPDLTLTESPTVSTEGPSRSFSSSLSEQHSSSRSWSFSSTQSVSATDSSTISGEDSVSMSSSSTYTPQFSTSLSTTPTASSSTSASQSPTSTDSFSVDMSRSLSLSPSPDHSESPTNTFTDTSTGTVSESPVVTRASAVLSSSHSLTRRSSTPSRFETYTSTETYTKEVSDSISFATPSRTSSGSPTYSRSVTLSPTKDQLTTTETKTVSNDASLSNTGNHTRTHSGDSWTLEQTRTVTATMSSSRGTSSLSNTKTITFTDTVTDSMPMRHIKRNAKGKTGSSSVTPSKVDSASETQTFETTGTLSTSNAQSKSRSDTDTFITLSYELSRSVTFESDVTQTKTITNSTTFSLSEFTETDYRTLSMSATKSISGARTASDTITESFSSQQSRSLITFTSTLTESIFPRSHSRVSSHTKSLTPTDRTATEVVSETRTETPSVSRSRSSSPSMSEVESVSKSPSTEQSNSPSITASMALTGSESVTASLSDSFTVSDSAQRSLTASRSGWVTASETITGDSATTTETHQLLRTVTISMSTTKSLPYRVEVGNMLLAQIRSVMFPSLRDSVAPCMSMAIYIQLPLLIIFMIQMVLFALARQFNWKVSTNTHLHVPMWRSALASTAYIGALVPCHLRCAYAHTLRCMVHLLVLQLVLESIVWKIQPVTQPLASLCAAIAIVTSQIIKPFTHYAYSYYRYPKDEELTERMHLAQMKRIIRLRRAEAKAAKAAERERRRREGLDDVSTTTDEDPEFAYDVENVVAFDYMDDAVSLNALKFGADVNVDFPEEKMVFGDHDDDLLAEDRASQVGGLGYVDLSFPGEDKLEIVDLFGDKREGLTSAGGVTTASSLGRGTSFIRDVPAIQVTVAPRSGAKKPKKKKKQGSNKSREAIEGSSTRKSDGLQSASDVGSVEMGSIASFTSPTHAAKKLMADVGSNSGKKAGDPYRKKIDLKTGEAKPTKPQRKRIAPGKDGVVVIPDFDDDFGFADDISVSTTSTDRELRKLGYDVPPAKGAATVTLDDLLDTSSDGSVDRHSGRSKSSTASRYRMETLPIVTYHLYVTIALVLSVGVLLFAVDRFRTVCLDGFAGKFGNLWGITALLDATVGDFIFALALVSYRHLLAGGEEGNEVVSELHPYSGEQRDRMYEHLSKRFTESD